MTDEPVRQTQDTKLAWVYAGPLAGRYIDLPLEEFERAVENEWAEDPDGKSTLDLTPAVMNVHADADRFAKGLPAESADEKRKREEERLEQYGAPDDPSAAIEPMEQVNRQAAKGKAAPRRQRKADDEPDADPDDTPDDDDDDEPAASRRRGSPKPADVSSEIVRSAKPPTVKGQTDDGQATTTRTMRSTRKV
jgi:hypothetical protein